MLDFVDKMLADLPAEMDGETPSPAVNHLLTVNDQIEVNENNAQFFHTYVANIVPMQVGKTGPTNGSYIF
jgi:hypothetical protein